VVVFSQTALGFNIKDPKGIRDTAEKTIREISTSAGDDSKYDVKMTLKQDGGLQRVTYAFVKDGKTLGTLQFVGTKNDMINSVDVRLTEAGQEDYGISWAANAIKGAIETRLSQALGK